MTRLTLASSTARASAPPLLSVEHLSLSYPGPGQQASQPILEDFCLELKSGEIVALLGSSGVGKSSLLRILAGLQAARSGHIRLKGQALEGPSPALGLVFQDPCLLPWLSLEENVAFGLDFHHQARLNAAEQRDRVQQLLAATELLPARGRYPQELSGGMAQRAALARTLARFPEVLLLDEPFSALDEVTRRDMQTLLLQLTTRYRTATLLVTHDIDEALLLADRILLIGGRPGHLIGQWTLTQAHPRDDTTAAHASLRVDILQTLKAARLPGLQ